jgi:glutathione S-transferase
MLLIRLCNVTNCVKPDRMNKNTLYIFAISHYCEKARWALELYGIPFELKYLIPGMNRPLAKKFGIKGGSLPFMTAGAQGIAGSDAIIDWGEHNRADGQAGLNGDDPQLVRDIEKRLDDVCGVHVRRYYYSNALLTDPASVRRVFARDLPLIPKISILFAWPKIVSAMIRLMDLGPQQGIQSRGILLNELDWLDGLLADGRTYLTGNILTRADITAASLLAPLVTPPEHPVYNTLPLPPELAATIQSWQNRPALQWVRRVYKEHR